MTQDGSPGLLVGVDGSRESQEAVSWGAAEAGLRGVQLIVCFVDDIGRPIALPLSADAVADADRHARAVVAQAAEWATATTPGLAVAQRVVPGAPSHELVRLAAHYEEVVLGHRGLGGFAQLLLGSVGAQVAAHSPCPAVIVRPAGKPDGPVLAGIDPSDRVHPAVGYAFAHAARHHLGVQLMHVYRDPITFSGLGSPLPDPDHGHTRQAAAELLAAAAAPLRDRYPDVPVELVALGGPPARALVEASVGASLLVVGRRGPGGLAGAVLGSVSQAVLRHANCPVAVVG